jgi:hypothetical protein
MTKSLITNPADTAVLDDIAAQEAAGGDPFGDNEEIVAVTVTDQAAEAAAKLTAEAGNPDAVDEPDAADPPVEEVAPVAAAAEPAAAAPAVAEPVAATPAPAPAPAHVPQYRVASKEAIAADTAALNAEKAAALQKMMDGDLEPAAFAVIDATVTQKLGQLLVQSTLAELNAQTAVHTETQAVLALMDRSAAAKQLDYRADPKAQERFDMELNFLSADPENAGISYAALLDKAHANVLAIRGIATTAAAPPPAPLTGKPPARTPEAAPLTLRGLPTAQVPLTGGTAADALGRLTGADYEAAFAKLTPAQQAAMVDD